MNEYDHPRPDQPTNQIDPSPGISDDGPSQLLGTLSEQGDVYKEYFRAAQHPEAIVHPDGVIELPY